MALSAVVFGVNIGAADAQGFKSAKTPEGVHRKAVVTVGDGKLYKDSTGDGGAPVSLMDVMFILEGGSGGDRIPVSRAPDAEKPDGWLLKTSFVEWNAVQMVDFAAQGGRKLVDVHNDATCALDFAKTGRSSCTAVGQEPDRQGAKVDYKMLIPVFAKKAEGSAEVYEGGFVRVTQGAVPTAVTPPPNAEAGAGQKRAGIELVIAIDATISMVDWFRPTADAVADFVAKVKADIGTGETPDAVRVGLVMYQDRKIGQECTLDFITEWKVSLTETSGAESADQTMEALRTAKVANCGSDEPEEAVYDALNRAMLDPKWKDGSFRVIALIGDAPPHPESNDRKNPLRLSQAVLLKEADERNIRFLATWITRDPNSDTSSFQNLAEQRSAALKGRFATLPGNPLTVRQELGARLWSEWTEIVKPARTAIASGATKQDPSALKALNPSDYEYPIIFNMLPDKAAGGGNQSFTRGWLANKVLDKNAIDEYVFMSRPSLRLLLGTLNVVLGQREQTLGAEEFITAVRSSLASQFKVDPSEILAQGETLSAMLKKKNVLPFDTGLLRFTAEEIRQWRPEDYDRVFNLLDERVAQLEKFTQVAANQRAFGNVPHFYVPQSLFP